MTPTTMADAPAKIGHAHNGEDGRFRALLPEAGWNALPAAVRRRFSNKVTVAYSGTVTHCRMNRAGRLLAQVLRVIGAPLPLGTDEAVPACVCVTEGGPGGSQVWTRLYGRTEGLPQIIQSTKAFVGPTGLEERVGLGIGMALTVTAEAGGLAFRSAHYFVTLFRRRIRLPAWLTPGKLTVTHVETAPDRFRFTLSIDHPLLGRLVDQHVDFVDREESALTPLAA